jgi:hypothetical protein
MKKLAHKLRLLQDDMKEISDLMQLEGFALASAELIMMRERVEILADKAEESGK